MGNENAVDVRSESLERDHRLVIDIDGVLTKKDEEKDYIDKEPNERVVARLREYQEKGFYIILYTARNMNTYDGRIGKINANTAKTLLNWLEEHDIPHDEIYYGKPWCGHEGYYVDDKAIRPSEFVSRSHDEIQQLLKEEQEV